MSDACDRSEVEVTGEMSAFVGKRENTGADCVLAGAVGEAWDTPGYMAGYDKARMMDISCGYDHQLHPSMTGVAMGVDAFRRVVSRGCAGCAGMCCVAFTLRHPPGRMLRDTLAAGQAPSSDLQFAVENFVCVDEAKDVYTCRMLDVDSGKCTAYDRRPALCRSYVCGAAAEGTSPGLGVMTATADSAAGLPAVQAWKAGSAYRRWLSAQPPAPIVENKGASDEPRTPSVVEPPAEPETGAPVPVP